MEIKGRKGKVMKIQHWPSQYSPTLPTSCPYVIDSINRKRYERAEIIFQKEKEEMEKIRESWVYSFEREKKEKEQ